jgi:hypothetical protein
VSRPRPSSHTVGRVPDPEPFDPIAEAHRQWSTRWPGHVDHMATATSAMRVQQLLPARVEDILKPYRLTFAAYEALRLLAFTRSGSLPMGKLADRLMVHPASVTNAISRPEQRGLVRRQTTGILACPLLPGIRTLAFGGLRPANLDGLVLLETPSQMA